MVSLQIEKNGDVVAFGCPVALSAARELIDAILAMQLVAQSASYTALPYGGHHYEGE